MGYQHYFTDTLGLRVSAYFGVGEVEQNMVFRNPERRPTIDTYYNKYLLIKTGGDIDFLWDFWEKENHVIGLNLGIGYRYIDFSLTDGYVSGEYGNIYYKTRSIGDPKLHIFYPSIGFHYYYKRHQFELSYRFGGAIKYKTEDNIFETFYGPNNSFMSNKIYYIKATPSYLSLSYTYRFSSLWFLL